MKKTLLTILCGSLLMGSTTSCGLAEWAVMSDPDASNSTKGAVVGATSGASAGSFIGSLMGNGYYSSRNNSLIGAAVGAVAGAAIGSAIGSDMDKKAEQRQQNASGNYYGGDELYGTQTQYTYRSSAPRRGDNCIYYAQSKTKLDGGAKKALDRVARKLINDPTACAEIYGYTDNTGTYNQRCRLSVERAQVVKAYLVKKGVPSSQIFCKGMADQRPHLRRACAQPPCGSGDYAQCRQQLQLQHATSQPLLQHSTISGARKLWQFEYDRINPYQPLCP